MLRVRFLGTGAAFPTQERNTSSIYVNHDGRELLLDCGEGTQRQMRRFGTGFDIDEIILTHADADHSLGLSGLVHTLDFMSRDKPLTIHVPQSGRQKVEQILGASVQNPSFPLRINSVKPSNTILSTDDVTVDTYETSHRGASMGIIINESTRKGRFDEDAALEKGVPRGPLFGKLHDGESVELEDGSVVHPEEVVGPPRPSRKVVYTGDTRPTKDTVDAAENASLLIHEATFSNELTDRAEEAAHSTAEQAGSIASQADAEELVLTHISPRYQMDTDTLAIEASEEFSGEVSVASDGFTTEIPLPSEE